MLLDKSLYFDDKRNISSGASTNTLDLKTGGYSFGERPVVVLYCDTTATGGTSVTASVQTSDDPTFTTHDVLASSGAILAANFTEKKIAGRIVLPAGIKKYLRVNYSLSGTFSGGAISTFISFDEQYGLETQN